jgi:hypothetical protein
MKPRVVIARPFSRSWWSLWVRDIEAGRATGFTTAQALRGRGRTVTEADMLTAMQSERLVVVVVDSGAFAAWTDHFARHGVSMPRPSRSPVVWLPADEPPETNATFSTHTPEINN